MTQESFTWGADAPTLNGGLCSVSPRTPGSVSPSSYVRSSATQTTASDLFDLDEETQLLIEDADRACRPHLDAWAPRYVSGDTVSAAWGIVLVKLCEERRVWADFDHSTAWLRGWCCTWFRINVKREMEREARRAEHAPVSLHQPNNEAGDTFADMLEEKTQLQLLREKWTNPQLQQSYETLPCKMREALDATVMADREPADAACYVEAKPSLLGGTRYRALRRIASEITDGDVTTPIPLERGSKPGVLKNAGNVHWLQASA